jgi:hypothetical protein
LEPPLPGWRPIGVTLRKARPFLLILGVVLAAGCGTVAGVSPPSTAKPAGTATGTSQLSGTLKQRAAADAKAILGKFVPPPGAVRLAKLPTLPGGSPVMRLNSAAQVDATGYWRASGAATTLLAWEKAHISRSFSAQDVLIGPPSWNTVYTLPAIPGALPTREMNVQFYDADGGGTVIMAEAMVSWQSSGPASEVVPASVTDVTIAASGPLPPQVPAPVTITSVPVVRRLAALVNALPLSTVSNDVPCPMGSGFTLTFRATVGGPPVAVADGPGACSQVTFRLNGKDEPARMPADASSYRAAILSIAGLHWKLS